MRRALHAFAAVALVSATAATQAEEIDRHHEMNADAIKFARPHHHHGPEATTSADAKPLLQDANSRDSHATNHRSDATKDSTDSADTHPFKPEKAAHDHDPHSQTADLHSFAGNKSAYDRDSVTTEPNADAAILRSQKSIFFRPGLIDKKTLQAIGLLKTHKPATAAVPRPKNRMATAVASTPTNVWSPRATTPLSEGVKTVLTGTGRFAAVVPRSNTPPSSPAVLPLGPRPTNLAAVHDAVVNGTGMKNTASMLRPLGGPAVIKSTAVINGTYFHAKPH